MLLSYWDGGYLTLNVNDPANPLYIGDTDFTNPDPQLLESAGVQLRVRPAPEVWSAIEYAAHTRDIAALHLFGVKQALTGTEPVFPPIDDGLVDAAAVGYADADPRGVVIEIGEETQGLSRLAEDAGPQAWSQGITVGEQRSDVRRMLGHVLHDALHHLDDVERGLAQLRA